MSEYTDKISGKLKQVFGGLTGDEQRRKEGVKDSNPDQKQAIHVEFTTDHLDVLYEQLRDKGMIFHEPPHDEPWERVMTAFDPDGYAVEIAQGRRGHDGPHWQQADA